MLPFGLRTKGIVLMCCMDDMLYLRIFACTNNAHFQFHVVVAQLEQRLQFKHFFLGFCVSLLVFSFLFLNCIHRLHCTCLNSTVCVCIWVCVRIFVVPMYGDGTMKNTKFSSHSKSRSNNNKNVIQPHVQSAADKT